MTLYTLSSPRLSHGENPILNKGELRVYRSNYSYRYLRRRASPMTGVHVYLSIPFTSIDQLSNINDLKYAFVCNTIFVE